MNQTTVLGPPDGSTTLATALVAAAIRGGSSYYSTPFFHTRPKPAKTARKCALPSCHIMHTHNGGYCCPEHCHEHRGKRGA